MNRMFLAALLAVGISGVTSSSLLARDVATTEPTTQPTSKHAEKWVCPMGCEGSASTQPGKCPKCGMKLQKEDKIEKHQAKADKAEAKAEKKQEKDDAHKGHDH